MPHQIVPIYCLWICLKHCALFLVNNNQSINQNSSYTYLRGLVLAGVWSPYTYLRGPVLASVWSLYNYLRGLVLASVWSPYNYLRGLVLASVWSPYNYLRGLVLASVWSDWQSSQVIFVNSWASWNILWKYDNILY